jgi:ribosomal 50S subunit-recycling heat shock protein
VNTSSVKPGDIVKVDVHGRIFHAEVLKLTDDKPRQFRIKALDSRVTYTTATSRQIKEAWYKSRARSNGGNA